ncbi:cell division protein DivIC [Alteribacillus persepolensis]|uniref:Cell division protein DivIC n=1 Tax=Alteribacillus persepolensis TaxID=568899 RepID=A0A1G8I090_9BACI|nr:septum formation initiator family protein [Alteribacillus persepolensis]SDI12339.1 cell division protein DivIC [Alteribacillus persepolensis]
MLSEKKKVTKINESYVQEKEQEQARLQEAYTKKRRGLVRRLTALSAVGVIIAVIFTVLLVSQWSTLEAKKSERAELEAQLEDLKAEESRLQEEVQNYQDLDYIAEVARRDYYLTKPGETLFKVPDQSSD